MVCASLALGRPASGAAAGTPPGGQARHDHRLAQVDAQNNWEGAVTAATAAFQAQHAGVDVKVEYQTWGDHLTKFDASLAGNNAPDVIELGNTEMTKYMAAGAFADLTSREAASRTRARGCRGLADSVTYKGKLYGVPYYAGARGVIYRKDHVPAGRDQDARRRASTQFEAAGAS